MTIPKLTKELYAMAKEEAECPLDAAACSESFIPTPESLWLVTVECRYNVIRVCVSGQGFYIPGQEPCWGFSHVDEWIQEIIPPNANVDAPALD